MSHSIKPVTLIVIASVMAVLAAPAYAQQGVDLRSPDARDAGLVSQPAGAVDMRSPDAQDSAHATVVDQGSPTVAGSDDDGWVIPALGIVATLSVAGGLTLVATRRRRHRQTHPAATA